MLAENDVDKLRRLADRVRDHTTAEVLTDLLGPDADAEAVRALADACEFDHAATLVFPSEDGQVTALLERIGATPTASLPSVVVRERLARRYGRPQAELDVTIQHARVGTRGLEIFCLSQEQAEPAMMRREAREDNEHHLALRLTHPHQHRLRVLCNTLLHRLGCRPDGGGYNPHEDQRAGGRTVFYFTTPGGSRLELFCAGRFAELLNRHLHGEQVVDAPHALLTLLTGHWAARAVHLAAKWRIADLLTPSPRTADEVAGALAADPWAVARLLRYLAGLGVLAEGEAETYSLTPVGELLHADNPFHDLASLYGEEFYAAWQNLGHAVRTGQTAFGATFGAEHFDYFAEQPEASRSFDRAMSAVSGLVADHLATGYDFPAGATVADIGGGDGTLLRAVLRAHPEVRGVLVDREHVTSVVVEEPRLSAHAGDFFTEIPSGHQVYLLSRVLHDWSDEDCLRILEVCRAACPPEAVLLVVERLLPEDGSRSLAQPWDMQMMAITGGRERTGTEYAGLLGKAGFTVRETRDLPVDLRLLVCAPGRGDR
ncbi:hypothetical protein JOF53_001112 [Crossiella equi]|uniref:Methyltransferase n=1 Tax=Crossiella equi TaxID=130796 RepID=A0ABS5A941_9PSEU|nr:methyltransferase [Crossiella equi]MBP2472240.1 hypothetical protein [Crossiella equi]